MRRVVVRYGIGYGRHELDFELEDGTTDEEIEEEVRVAVMERLNWSWKVEDEDE